jgi:hypothetical protein
MNPLLFPTADRNELIERIQGFPPSLVLLPALLLTETLA